METIRTTGEPCFLECATYRFRAHSMFDAQSYRSKRGNRLLARQRSRSSASANGWRTIICIHPDDVADIEREVDAEITQAVAFAEAGTLEPVEEVERFVVMQEVPQ